MAPQKGKAAKGSHGQRRSKRELERQRAHLRRVLVPSIALIAVAGVVGAYVLTLPPPPPAHPLGPGEYWSNAPMHIHPRLSMYIGQGLQPLPQSIGIDPSLWVDHSLDAYSLDGPTLSPLHTHDSTGMIHVESKVTRGYTLGEFFAVWGQPLGPSQAATLHADQTHRLTLKVAGQPSTLWKDVVFTENLEIEIHLDQFP